ncbi:MarR family winged helix-turn-helix transcriptional regulator [Streptomyces sp. NPDC059740]|uniref:MarR family winged helix-turn-helix transcriptional regulator n=1 Tax=Streptomyces sp. NPDC059740 TaxID=3346926 RepID=UPI00365C6564
MAADTRPPDRALDRIQALPTWLLNRTAARGRDLVGRALAAEGLRTGHHALLAAVADLQPVTQADLGRCTGFDRKDVTGLLDDLAAAGLVRRSPHPTDRRKNAVTLTDRGGEVLARCADAGDEANRALLAPLDAGERAQLLRLLRRVAFPDEDRAEG